jgi:acetyl esterase/lipase
LKKSILLLVSVFVLFVAWLGYFIFANEAPITKGEMLFDIEYKEGLNLDVYLPTKLTKKKIPVVIYVHGGAWIGGSKITVNNNRFNMAFNDLRADGYAIVSVDYTIATEDKSPFPKCIVDVEDAIAWVKTNAKKYNFDLENLGIFGESAGGHIAMMVTFPDTAFYAVDFKKTNFNYLVDVYGPTDLEGVYKSDLADSLNKIVKELPESLAPSFDMNLKLFGFNPEEDSLRAQHMMKIYSPLSFLNKNIPPVLIIHGKEDQVVPLQQSIDLDQKLSKLNIAHEFHQLDSVNHGFIGANDAQMDSVQVWVRDFILSHYRKSNSIK